VSLLHGNPDGISVNFKESLIIIPSLKNIRVFSSPFIILRIPFIGDSIAHKTFPQSQLPGLPIRTDIMKQPVGLSIGSEKLIGFPKSKS